MIKKYSAVFNNLSKYFPISKTSTKYKTGYFIIKLNSMFCSKSPINKELFVFTTPLKEENSFLTSACFIQKRNVIRDLCSLSFL